MRTVITIAAITAGITVFVLWCAIRAGTRPTPRPDNKGRKQ